MAVEMTAKMNRGTLAKTGEMVMKLVHTVYIVGVLALGVVSAMQTTRNLPKPPAPESVAAMSPPTSLPLPSPACHSGTYDAAAVNAPPTMCIGTYMPEKQVRLILETGINAIQYVH